MRNKNLTASTFVIGFMLSCMMLGFLTIGSAAAAVGSHASGTWVKKDYAIKGEWSIEQRGNQHVISFNDKFKTKRGPDLKVPANIDINDFNSLLIHCEAYSVLWGGAAL